MTRHPEKFKSNLSKSQSQENQFSQTLQQIGYTATTTQSDGSFKPYDVCATIPNSNIELKYEIKLDLRACDTGNIAVELFKELNGERTMTGLSATQADFYVYTFPGDANFYIIHVDVLKNLVRNKQYTKRCFGGNGGYFVLALFNKKFFLDHCMILKKIC